MFEIVFLGTSSAAPSIYRGLSAAVVLAGEQRFLVDCGEGTQRQLLRSGIGFKKLTNILLTHAHLDHILGVGGLVSTFTRWERIEQLNIWGGKPALDRIQSLIYDVVLRNEKPGVPIHLNTLEPGLVFEGKHFTITAFPVQHRGQGCFGFVFQEHTRHPFLVEKAEELGVPAGPERGKLVKGESITLADGREITPEMVLGEAIPGMRLVFSGDTVITRSLAEQASGADVLVCEATFLERDRDLARMFGHTTAHQAAVLARDIGVKHLLLNHISRRYREHEMVSEARAVLPGAYVVRDLDHFVMKRGQPLEKKLVDEAPEDVDEDAIG